jgi:uncharacterized membrane protein YfcA
MDATVAVLPLTGCLVGFLVGVTGMGGGALMTPFLILVIGTRPVVAVGTDLVYGAATKIVGAYLHWRQGTVDLQLVKRLAIASVPGGLAAVVTMRLLAHSPALADGVVRRGLGGVLVAVAVLMLARLAGVLPAALPERWSRVLQGGGTLVAGGLVGVLVGFTSVGSGALLVPFLACVFPQNSARIVGTDVFHAAILLSVTAVGHAEGGAVDWSLAAVLLMGSIPGVALGSWMSPRIPANALRAGLASVLLLTGLTLV